MSKDLVGFGEDLDGSACRIGIVKTRWNPEIVDSLYEGVRAALKETGVKDANIYDTTVPGSFELPLAARFLAMSRQCDVVITIGCLIKGDTMHFEYIAEAVTKGLMDVRIAKKKEGGRKGRVRLTLLKQYANHSSLPSLISIHRSSCKRPSPSFSAS